MCNFASQCSLYKTQVTRLMLAMGLLILPGPSIAAVDDSKVLAWIVAAYDGVKSADDAKAKAALVKPRKAADTFKSWIKLKECRDAGNSLDLNLASAEHYLYIRSFAAEKGEQDIQALPKLYGDIKERLGPAGQLLKTSTQPVSAPDVGVIRWGENGVAAGLADYKAANNKEPSAKTGAVQQFKLALEGYYENYSQKVKNPSCKVNP